VTTTAGLDRHRSLLPQLAAGCHELTSGTGDATWLSTSAPTTTYSIDAWWAERRAGGWTTQAVFEVMVGVPCWSLHA